MKILLLSSISYALGCVVGAYYVVRWRSGVDVRESGSGNAGARNVLRSGDRAAAAATILWDVIKGALAVLIAQRVLPQDWAGGLAFVFVVAGHIWPAQLSFHGGKGAATALGCMLVISPAAMLVAAVIGGLVGGLGRSITAGGLAAIAAAPPLMALRGAPFTLVAGVAVACTAVLVAHHPAMDRSRQPSVGRAEPAREIAS